MQKKSSFGLVIPCYNEEKAIPDFLKELDRFIELYKVQCCEFELSILFVDNGSLDNSLLLLDSYCANKLAVKLCVEPNLGYGAALKTGFHHLHADYLGFVDLDQTYPLNDFIRLLNEATKHGFDMVMGGRLHYRSDISASRKTGNWLYSFLTRVFFKTPIVDMCTGMRVFRSGVKNQITNLKENDLSFSIELTICALKRKWKINECPIDYRERAGESKLSIVKDGLKFLVVLIRTALV